MNTDNDLIVPLDRYERDIEQRLAEAYWNDNADEVELLQKRMNQVRVLREYGEEFYTRF